MFCSHECCVNSLLLLLHQSRVSVVITDCKGINLSCSFPNLTIPKFSGNIADQDPYFKSQIRNQEDEKINLVVQPLANFN